MGLKRYTEAEESYERVLVEHAEGGRQTGSDDHIQRIPTQWFLVECYDKSWEFEEALAGTEDLLDSLAKMGDAGYGLKHPFHGQVASKLAELRSKLRREIRDNG